MHFTDYFAITERYLDILNPTSHEKLMLLAEYCGVREDSRVLDIGCGKGYLLRIWAKEWNIQGVGIDVNATSIAVAREKTEAEGLETRLIFVEGEVRDYSDNHEPFNVVTCIGAPFAIGTFREAVRWMKDRVKPDGIIAIGDEYLPAPLPEHIGEDSSNYHTLSELEFIFKDEDLFLTGMIAASQDDWDRYASGGWRAGYDWLRGNPRHPDYEEVKKRLEEGRNAHLRFIRQYVGWAMLVLDHSG